MNKNYILKKNEEIGALIKIRKSVGNKYYAVYYNVNKENGPRIAISVSKKYGNAVIRNYEKRVTKEIIRDIVPKLPNLDILIVIRKELSNIKFPEKQKQLIYLMNKLKSKAGEKNGK